MNIFIVLVAILQSTAISLGMGSSTIAIANFFVAISDGEIDKSERRMMGVVYVVLRVAMILILLTGVSLLVYNASKVGLAGISATSWAQASIIAVLFTNATLMTMRIMPSNFGPAIQAGSWYTLGIISALIPLGLASFSYGQFLLGYATAIVLAISIVNGLMAYLKK